MIIGIAGKKQVGKDTSADYIAKHFLTNKNDTFQRAAFSTKLKQVTGDLFGLDFFNMTPEEKELHRHKLQFVGDRMRDLEPYIWINALFRKVPKNVAISDVRYPNEVNRIKELGGYVIHVSRDTGMIDAHNSETSLDDFNCYDARIMNNGTFDQLYDQLDRVVAKIGCVFYGKGIV